MVDHREQETLIDESLAKETLERSRSKRLPDGAGAPLDPSDIDLGERYEVREQLGQGGMGAVLLARDLELDRDVAVKLIRGDLAERPEALARFRREVQLASQVTHRNVLRVYDLGESDGQRFLTMQFVDGEDLGALIGREGPLEVETAVELFRQMASALAAAHERGVVHRDLKPQNVLVGKDQSAYVADFGLASSAEASSRDVTITRTGVAIGTPLYMAPEQLAGGVADERSDLYALGLILYEMLTGRLPFEGDTPLSVMTERLNQEPVPLARWRTDSPVYLRQLLERCLQREPSLRYQSAKELLLDLDAGRVRRPVVRARLWLLVAGLLLMGLFAGLYYGLSREERSVAASEAGAQELAPLVAIAPFENLTGDTSLDWLEGALARLVRDDLSQSRHVRVLSEQRSRELMGDTGEIDRELARQQSVATLVSADLSLVAGNLVLSSRTDSLETSTQLDSSRIRAGDAAAVLAGMTQVAASVRRAMNVPVTEEINLLAVDFAAANPEAYESFVIGSRAYTEFRYDEAERALRDALQLSPGFVMARYRLSQLLAEVSRTDEAQAEIERTRRESAHLGRREQLYIEAQAHLIARRNADSIEALQRLLDLYPYETEARFLLANVLITVGRARESLDQLELLRRFDPANSVVWSLLGQVKLQIGDVPGAVGDYRRYAELESDTANAHELLGDAYRAQGELVLAATAYHRSLSIDPDFHSAEVKLATVDALDGRSVEAAGRLGRLLGDEAVSVRTRIDAGLLLVAIQRARNRFSDALASLRRFSKLAEAEGPRWALVLSLEGLCHMELGELGEARRVLERAIQETPGVATRYLFALALLQLRTGELDDAARTAEEIESLALPPENPDRTENKAAAFLRGRIALARSEADRAIAELTRAVTMQGYEYAVYRAALALAQREAGQLDQALANARLAADHRDGLEPRLDLELGRLRARWLLAEIQDSLGDGDSARQQRALVAKSWDVDETWLDDDEPRFLE